ncbi:hypothetical protein JYP51_01600 [Ponticoccus gilvus]|nr:hypothetical protein [Enemella evansiae]
MKNIVPFRAIGAFLCIATVTACAAPTPGPSVPFQPGSNLHSARAAFVSCLGPAERSGNNTVAGHYVGSVFWGGLVVGPVIVASNSEALRYGGEVAGMDRCLGQQGYARRDLTPQEVRALNAADIATRRAMLDHLIGGGTLQTFARG